MLDKKSGGFIPEEENLRDQGDWKQFTLYQRGRKNAAACQKTPQTCAIIDTIRDATSCKRGQVSVLTKSQKFKSKSVLIQEMHKRGMFGHQCCPKLVPVSIT